MRDKKYPVFTCKKCGHNLYLESRDMKKLANFDCPNCGEEAGELWIFSHLGNYGKEQGNLSKEER